MTERGIMTNRLRKIWLPRSPHLRLALSTIKMVRIGYEDRNPLIAREWTATLDRAVADLPTMSKIAPNDECCFDQPANADASLLVGLSGTGKTTTVRKIFLSLPQVIVHEEYPLGSRKRLQPTQQLVWLLQTCPTEGSQRAFCINAFRSLDAVLGTGYERLYVRSSVGTEVLLAGFASVVHQHGLGLLVIDEVQLLASAPGTSGERFLKFILLLMNVVKIPVLLIGTPEAERMIGRRLFAGRRSVSSGFFRMEPLSNRGDLEELVAAIWDRALLRETTPFRELGYEMRERILDEVYVLTAGVQALISVLFVEAVNLALLVGDEALTMDHLRAAAANFEILRDEIAAIREKGAPADPAAYADALRSFDSEYGTDANVASTPGVPAAAQARNAKPKRRTKRMHAPAKPEVSEAERQAVHAHFKRKGAISDPVSESD
jgi:AAA domain